MPLRTRIAEKRKAKDAFAAAVAHEMAMGRGALIARVRASACISARIDGQAARSTTITSAEAASMLGMRSRAGSDSTTRTASSPGNTASARPAEHLGFPSKSKF